MGGEEKNFFIVRFEKLLSHAPTAFFQKKIYQHGELLFVLILAAAAVEAGKLPGLDFLPHSGAIILRRRENFTIPKLMMFAALSYRPHFQFVVRKFSLEDVLKCFFGPGRNCQIHNGPALLNCHRIL